VKLGVPVKFVRYPNESHGMSRNGQPKHRLERLEHNIGWFDQWLLSEQQETTQAGD
jgi:dipeptidyl aminopeptidase/acylaminoacyl peptidase